MQASLISVARALAGGWLLCGLLAPASAGAQPLTRLLRKEQSALTLLEQSTRQVLDLEQRSRDAREALERLRYRISEAERRARALEQRGADQQRDVRRRVKTLYKVSRGGFARMALDAADGEGLFRRISAASLVLRRDVREIALYKKELTRLQRLRRELLQQRKQQVALQRQLQIAADQTREAHSKLTWNLRQIRGSRKLRAELAGELNRQQRLLLSRVRNLDSRIRRAAGLAPFKGRLPRPVEGSSVVGHFGASRDRRQKLEVVRHGLTFRTPPRARVRSLAPGTVRLAGPLPGYGTVVLVQHSGGYYTVYGFLARTRVAEGTQVYRRTTLGWAGLDPLSGKPAAYLEIRRGTEALDPAHWLAR